MTRRIASVGLRIAISLALLGLTLWFVDVQQVSGALARARWAPALVGLLLSVPVVLVLALRWSFTARRLDVDLPLPVAWREYYGSVFINQVLPGGVLGDVGRVVRGGLRTPEQRGAVARAVVWERISGQLVLWAVVAATVVFTNTLSFWDVLAATACVLVVLTGFVAVGSTERLRNTWWGRSVDRVRSDLGSAFVRRGAWLVQLGLSLASVALLAGTFVACVLAVNAPANAMQLVLISPAILAVTSLPATAGGWGLREGASAVLFEFVGLEPATGVAASALYGVLGLVGALPGAVLITLPIGDTHAA